MGCLCRSVIQWVSARCLARFSLGGTDSIHSPDNRPAIHSRGWEKLSSEKGRVRKSAKKKKKKRMLQRLCAIQCATNRNMHMTQCQRDKKNSRAGENKRKHWMEMRAFQLKRDFLVVFRKNMQIVGYKKPGHQNHKNKKAFFFYLWGCQAMEMGSF